MPHIDGAPNINPIIRKATQSFILRQTLLQKLLSPNFPSDTVVVVWSISEKNCLLPEFIVQFYALSQVAVYEFPWIISD